MKNYLLIPVIIFLTIHAYPQQLTQTVKGIVLDGGTLRPLPGATVILAGTVPLKGVVTDPDGHFSMEKVPVGRQTFKVTFIGYRPAVIPEILVGSAKEVYLEVKLTETPTSIQGVTVTAGRNSGEVLNEMATLNARSFSVEETGRYAASINDPGRMALSYAGITNGNDATNQIIIRGNSPNGLLWRLEGVEIPAPSHFAEEGNAAGFVSILNANMLSVSDFYIGAFPAEFGNAFSGVFDIRLRNGNSDRREYAFQMGVMGTDLTMEGPFSQKHKASYLMNYRYSTFALLQGIGINVMGSETPHYQDMSFKFYLPTKKSGVFSLWGIGGLASNQSADPVKDSTQWEIDDDRCKYHFDTGMGAAGITHFIRTGPNSYLRSVISVSENDSREDNFQLNSEYILHRFYKDHFGNVAYRVNSCYNTRPNPRWMLRTGFNYNIVGLNMFSKEDEAGNLVTTADEKGFTSYLYLYNENKFYFTDQLTATIGLSYTCLFLSRSQSLEPQGAVEWAFAPHQTVGFAGGIYSRYEELNAYFMAIPVSDSVYVYPNKDLKLKKTAHFVLSYRNDLTDKLSFKCELYYQHLYDLPVAADTNSTFSTATESWSGWDADSLVSDGTGRNYGIELTLEKRFSDHYYMMATASLFDSKFRAADGLWYNTQYNSHYVFNLIGGKEFPLGRDNNNILGVNARGVYAGGQRYTPIDREASQVAGKTVVFQKQRFTKQFPDYFRIDLGVSYRINRPRVAHILALDIQNATNRKNVRDSYYDVLDDQVILVYHFGLVPVVSYKIEF
jgi:hypothetical protein